MSSVASSSMRTLRTQVKRNTTSIPLRQASTSSSQSESTYTRFVPRPFERSSYPDTRPQKRPPRPSVPTFFTGTPALSAEMQNLQSTLKLVQDGLRAEYLYPLPKSLELPSPPQVTWVNAQVMTALMKSNVKHGQYKRILETLNDLNRIRYLARLGGKPDLAEKIENVLGKYIAGQQVSHEEKRQRGHMDKLGRAYAQGKRKTAVANVWIVPTKTAKAMFETPAEGSLTTQSVATTEGTGEADMPIGEILVNDLPMALTFGKSSDRDMVLRPLRLTGLLGAYNIYVKTYGGGPMGQAGATALGIARALTVMRQETESVLFAAGMLRRDPRMVERKKTNLLKARKKRAWVKR